MLKQDKTVRRKEQQRQSVMSMLMVTAIPVPHPPALLRGTR